MTYLTGYTGNLTVAGDILPATSNLYSLGSNAAKWSDTHIGPNSIYIQDTANASVNATLTVTNGVLFIDGATQVQAPGIQNGNSNIAITANANIDFTSNSNTTFKVTSTGANVIGDLGISGNIVFNPVYGQFWSNVTQSATANTATQITLNNGGGDSRVTYNTNGNITISHAGVYAISAIAQTTKGAGGGSANLYMWFKKNGTSIANSAVLTTIASSSQNLTTSTWIANIAANDVLSAWWLQNDAANLNAVAENVGLGIPEIPSVSISITPVGA